MAALVQVTEQLAAQVAVDQPGVQALTETAVLLATLDKLKAIALSRVADVDRRGLHDLDGSPSTATWVAQQQTGMVAATWRWPDASIGFRSSRSGCSTGCRWAARSASAPRSPSCVPTSTGRTVSSTAYLPTRCSRASSSTECMA
jgi:hypothetical protein